MPVHDAETDTVVTGKCVRAGWWFLAAAGLGVAVATLFVARRAYQARPDIRVKNVIGDCDRAALALERMLSDGRPSMAS